MTDPNNVEWDDVAFSELCYDASLAAGSFPAAGVCQRMIRRGPWKLIYYHGQACQLFHLDQDPRELNDRASDPACQELIEDLTDEVLNGWDPEQIRERITQWNKDSAVLSGWTRTVQPRDQYRWEMRREMAYLDEEQMEKGQRGETAD